MTVSNDDRVRRPESIFDPHSFPGCRTRFETGANFQTKIGAGDADTISDADDDFRVAGPISRQAPTFRDDKAARTTPPATPKATPTLAPTPAVILRPLSSVSGLRNPSAPSGRRDRVPQPRRLPLGWRIQSFRLNNR